MATCLCFLVDVYFIDCKLAHGNFGHSHSVQIKNTRIPVVPPGLSCAEPLTIPLGPTSTWDFLQMWLQMPHSSVPVALPDSCSLGGGEAQALLWTQLLGGP